MARTVSDYMTAAQVAAMLRLDAKTIRRWISRFHLGRQQGVYKMPRGYLFQWTVFEREFVQRRGADEP